MNSASSDSGSSENAAFMKSLEAVIDVIGRADDSGLDDRTRGIDAVRADVFADLLLGNATMSPAAGRVEVRVTVPADTLMGTSDEPGELAGYGPVPASTARRLATQPDTLWRRLITEPVDATLLDYEPENVPTTSRTG